MDINLSFAKNETVIFVEIKIFAMGIRFLSLLVIGISLFFTGCVGDTGLKHVNRLDLLFYDYCSLSDEEKNTMLDSMRQGVESLFFIMGDSAGEAAYNRYSESPAVRMFTPDVCRRLPRLDSIEHVLTDVEKNIRHLLPTVRVGDIYGIVSQYSQSVFIVDSVLLVGLNHYLGSDYPGYSNFDEYKRLTKSPKYMPYDIVEALVASDFPFSPSQDVTVLNRMLYHGVLIEAKMQILPDANLADALGFTDAELEWAQKNGREVWNALIMRKLLYSTSVADADRLLLPSPATVIIHPEAPGRIGRYVGYMIVQSYIRNNPEISLEQMLAPEFYNSPLTLVKSGYNGVD